MPENRLEINVNDAVTVSAPKDLMAAGLDRPNRIVQSLRGGRFFWTIEFVAASAPVPREDLVIIDAFVRELAGRPEIAGFSVTDRVHSDQDPDPVTMAVHVREHSGSEPLIHWAGKDRDLEGSRRDLEADARAALGKPVVAERR
jgi:hypothetical protein